MPSPTLSSAALPTPYHDNIHAHNPSPPHFASYSTSSSQSPRSSVRHDPHLFSRLYENTSNSSSHIPYFQERPRFYYNHHSGGSSPHSEPYMTTPRYEQQPSSSPVLGESSPSVSGYDPRFNASHSVLSVFSHPELYYHTHQHQQEIVYSSRGSISPEPSDAHPHPTTFTGSSSPSERCRKPCCVDTSRVQFLPNSSSSYSANEIPPDTPQIFQKYNSPDSPLIPSFSPSSSSSSSSSASPFTPKALSPISGQRQRVIVSDYNRSSRQPDLISSRSISEISKQHLENEHKREFDRSDCENRDTVKKQDIHVDSHSSTADQQQEQSKTRKNTKVSAKLIKIPRPANSFMLYRAENSKKYPGLVATELSAKLGESWRNEPQEVRDRYEELAEQAKKEHAIRYPDYKFAPIKRGTGKRALKLAAEAIANEMAEMDAAALLISMASMAPTPAATIASSPVSCDRRPNPSRSPSLSTSVSATGTRPKAQRPLKASSLNSSNVSASHISKLGSPCNLQDFRPSNPIVSNVNHIMETSNAVNITTATESLQATNRAYPQLSPPLILFREALARRSPQLASSLVAQIVINVWFGVTDELRERYEALAENDPRFKDKIGQYVPHSQISNTPTTASEAMMANQIAQLLKKAAVTDQLTFPQSNKRKRAISTSNTAASKLEKLASTHVLANHAQASVKHTRSPSSNHIADSTCSKSEPMPLPMNGDTNSPPATFETSPTIPTKADSALPQETLPTPVSPKTSILHVVNDLAPENLIPMPMPSPNKRQAKASPGHVTYMTNSNPSRPKISMVPVSPESDKIDLHMMQTSPQENEMTTTNRPIRHISRPLKYSD